MFSPEERVLRAFRFEQPDRIPRCDVFWEYPDEWAKRFGPKEALCDVTVWVADETPFPTAAKILKEENDWTYKIDGWGRTIREKKGAYFPQVLKVAIPEGTDIDSIIFESPLLDLRYSSHDENDKEKYCYFAKTGGPYLRTTYLRGEAQFLMDIAGDPELAKTLADKVATHLIAIGIESMRRWKLQDAGAWIFDDFAYNEGLMFSPKSFERVFLPAFTRMVKAYKDAGARYVLLHSDGNVMSVLDMLLDAGFDGLHPLEKRAGMNMREIRKRYPGLILLGGMCNTETLIRGPVEKVKAEAREIIDLGRNGGVVIGTHSISPEIPIELYAAYHETCMTYGTFL